MRSLPSTEGLEEDPVENARFPIRRVLIVAVLCVATMWPIMHYTEKLRAERRAALGHELPPWAAVSPEQLAEATRYGVPAAFEDDLGMCFVLIPSGTFPMGSPVHEAHRNANETPHDVTLTRPYYLQVREVTNALFCWLRAEHDSGTYEGLPLNAPPQPVVNVTLEEARAFAADVSELSDARVYRLPTEAEWERACRAGTDTPYPWGTREADGSRYANGTDVVTQDEFGWPWTGYPVDDGFRVTAPAASLLASPWGLYDMAGNVWEWCADGQDDDPTHSVVDPVQDGGYSWTVRGGAWNHHAGDLRCARRRAVDPEERADNVGFRLVSPLPEPPR